MEMEKKSQKRKDSPSSSPVTQKKPKTKHVRNTLAETGITLQKGVPMILKSYPRGGNTKKNNDAKECILEVRIHPDSKINLMHVPPSAMFLIRLGKSDMTDKDKVVNDIAVQCADGTSLTFDTESLEGIRPFQKGSKIIVRFPTSLYNGQECICLTTESTTKAKNPPPPHNSMFLEYDNIQIRMVKVDSETKSKYERFPGVLESLQEWKTSRQHMLHTPHPTSHIIFGNDTTPSIWDKQKHWMGLRRTLFIISTNVNTVKTTTVVTFDLNSGKLHDKGYDCTGSNRELIILNNIFPLRLNGKSVIYGSIAIVYDNDPINYNWEDYVNEPENEDLKQLMHEMTPNTKLLKSAFQKILRARPTTCTLRNGKVFDSEKVLKACIAKMFDPNQHGQWIPDIGKSSSALTNVLKRLAIIGFEDSYLSTSGIQSLLFAALLSENEITWRPSVAMIDIWIQCAIKMLKNERAVVYNNQSKKTLLTPTYEGYTTTQFSLASVILETLGAMEGDKRMLRDIHDRKTIGKPRFVDPNYSFRPDTILFPEYCIDQHTHPDIALLLYDSTIHHSTEALPFKKTLHHLFTEYTGRNPRRGDPFHTQSDWIEKVQKAQSAIYQHMIAPIPCPIKTYETMPYEIPVGNLAGRIPTEKLQLHRKRVTIDPNNMDRMVVSRVVSRDNTKIIPSITQKENDELQSYAESILTAKNGIKLIGKPVVTFHSDAYARVDISGGHKTWLFKTKGNEFEPWEKVRFINVPVFRNPTFESIRNIVEKNKISLIVIRRVITLLNSWSPKTSMPGINRAGGSLHEKVMECDGDTYGFLKILSEQFPDAFWPNATRNQKDATLFTFYAKTPVVKQQIKQELQNLLSKMTTSDTLQQHHILPTVRVEDDLTEKQVTMFHRIKESLEKDEFMRTIYLYMRTGAGKTYLTASLLSMLWKHHPDSYGAIWTVPQSGIASVAKELNKRLIRIDGSPVVKLVTVVKATKTKNDAVLLQHGIETEFIQPNQVSSWTPSMGYITLMHHDDIKKCDFDSSQFIMVVDEAHKCMNATIRTGFARELAANARYCFLLSGTPITKNEEQLCGWLQSCVPFDIEKGNQWTAVNSMFKQMDATDIAMIRSQRDVTIPPKYNDTYWGMLPIKWGGQTPNPGTREQIHTAFKLCQKISDERMTKDALRLTQQVENEHEILALLASHISPSEDLLQSRLKEMTLVMNQPVSQRPALWRNNWELLLSDMVLEIDTFADQLLPLRSHRVIMVADTSEHAERLHEKLLKKGEKYNLHIDENYIHIGSGDFIEMETPSATVPHIIIVTKTQCAGWNGTMCTVLMKGVYFGNQADRTQMEGRIDRLGSITKVRWIKTYTAGIQERFLRHHEMAKSLALAIQDAHRL